MTSMFPVQMNTMHGAEYMFHSKDDWTVSMKMEFNGANIFLQDTGNNTCQFGGVFFSDIRSIIHVRDRNLHSFCKSLSLQPETINTEAYRQYIYTLLCWLFYWESKVTSDDY